IAHGVVDWQLVAANRATIPYIAAHHRAMQLYSDGNLHEALVEWRAHPTAVVNSRELVMLAESFADEGNAAAEPYIESLRKREPAAAGRARWRYRQHRLDDSVAALRRALIAMRRDPWENVETMGRALDLARSLAVVRAYAPGLIDAMSQPFAAGQWEDVRRWYL